MNTKLKFAFEKETKGAVRYQEVGEDGAPAVSYTHLTLPTIYSV